MGLAVRARAASESEGPDSCGRADGTWAHCVARWVRSRQNPPMSSNGLGGGGGNRTRVRGRTGQNLYKRSPPLNLARRPEAAALPAGPPHFNVTPPQLTLTSHPPP